MFKGLYGSIIVTDPDEDALKAHGAAVGRRDEDAGAQRHHGLQGAGDNDDAPTIPVRCRTSAADAAGAARAPRRRLCERRADSTRTGIRADRSPRATCPNIQKPGPPGPGAASTKARPSSPTASTSAHAPARPRRPARSRPVRTRSTSGRSGTPPADCQRGDDSVLPLAPDRRAPARSSAGPRRRPGRPARRGAVRKAAFNRAGGTSTSSTPTARSCSIPATAPDVVVAIPATAAGQVLTLWTQDFERTGQPRILDHIPTVRLPTSTSPAGARTVFTIDAGDAVRASIGEPVESSARRRRPCSTRRPSRRPSWLDGPTIQDIKLQATGQRARHVNGASRVARLSRRLHAAFDTKRRRRYAAAIGDTLELTVTNTTGAHHPFHLHGFSIQPIELTEGMGLARTTRSRTASSATTSTSRPATRSASASGSTIGRCRTASRRAAARPVGLPLPHLLPRRVRHDFGVRLWSRADGNERPYIDPDDTADRRRRPATP